MIWRTFFLLNLDFLFYQQCMWFNHKQLCLIQSRLCQNTAFSSSRSLLIRFSLLCSMAECCKQTLFTCFNKMKRRCCFLCMCIVLLFCCIEFTSRFYKGKLKFLYLFNNAEKLKYWSSGVRTAPYLDVLLPNVIDSSHNL